MIHHIALRHSVAYTVPYPPTPSRARVSSTSVTNDETRPNTRERTFRVTVPRPSSRRSPVVLVVDDQEWSARSLETVLMPNGFAVLRAFTGAKGLERARADSPDIMVVARTLPDIDGLALCRALRGQAMLGDRVPLLVRLSERPTRAERLMALRAGAWDILVPPIDAEELILRLETYVRAKFEGDQIRETGLLDARTGFYNVGGLERRATELGAWAKRQGEPLSCVILGVVRGNTADETAFVSAAAALADVLRKTGRTSDAIGRMGQTEFAVLAPGTDGAQAIRLAQRLAAALKSAGIVTDGGQNAVRLRGGYDTVSDAREKSLKGPELITRAAVALGRAKTEHHGEWLRPFKVR